MRSISIFLIILISLNVSNEFEYGNNNNRISFDVFRIKYGKFYSNSEEFRKRSVIFAKNVQRIIENNRHAEANNMSFRMALNSFADIDDNEFRSGYIPLRNMSMLRHKASRSEVLSMARMSSSAPKSKNWAALGKVVPVKNQGPCNACWAFALVSVIESYYAIKGHRLTAFSEQQLVDCSLYDNGCVGGNHYIASLYVMEYGVMRQMDYPYVARQSSCFYSPSVVPLVRPRYGYILSDENFLQTVVGTQGPVAVAVFAGNNFRFYSRGLLYDPYCEDPIHNKPNHTVVLVGYDTDRRGRKYWLAKNSWGSNWGMGGYIMLPRGVNYCGITYEPVYVAF